MLADADETIRGMKVECTCEDVADGLDLLGQVLGGSADRDRHEAVFRDSLYTQVALDVSEAGTFVSGKAYFTVGAWP